MRYESKLTEKGNSSYSYISQAEADTRAKALDDSGCTGCTGCARCARWRERMTALNAASIGKEE